MVEENAYIAIDSIDKAVHETITTSRYAGFWMRFWAYLLDLAVVGSINRLIIYPLFRFFDISVDSTNMFSPIEIATTVIFYLYFVLMTKYFQQTLGKMVFGLKVIDMRSQPLTWSTVFFREVIGKFISKFILFIGFLFVAFSEKKQGLHDQIADTTVVHE
jgi:uncharacterized RDD family membrane protein YckC